MTGTSVLGIVVPTLNEELRLPLLLNDLHGLSLPHKVIVADGGSTDSTAQIAERAGATVVRSTQGRGRQMNAGAAALHTPWLLFLHADSRLHPETAAALSDWIQNADTFDVGVFGFALEGDDWFWRFIEFGQRLRQRLYGLAYGDQGLLVRQERFAEVGGFPELPLMEDVEILKKLKRDGRLRTIDAPLITSARRYESDGRWVGWIRNTFSIGLYQLGISAERLAGWYKPERPPQPARLARTGTGAGKPIASGPEAVTSIASEPRALLVFAKAPRPGTVKTRLARDVGDLKAAEIYSRMGRDIVEAVTRGSYGITICFDPPDAELEMRAWLGGGAAEEHQLFYRAQASGDLGARLTEAVDHAFTHAERVCVIGTDTPDVDRGVVDSCFRALESADCVLGPATDGGYYLIGLAAQNRPELFSGIEWSTPAVMSQTLDRARRAGIRVDMLRPLSDVDVVEDLPAELRG